jgi:DedD protein
MDRRVKERLIGACILVVLVVAVVPELLSGPNPAEPTVAAPAGDAVRLPGGAPDPVRNVTVDLTTSKPAVADPAAAPTASPPTVPQPTVAQPMAPQPMAPQATAPEPAVPQQAMAGGGADSAPVAPRAAADAVETPVAPPTSGQAFAVQLGSFANRSNAENLLHQLKTQGFSIYMNAEGSGGSTRYRVRVGPFANRDAAERVVEKLKGLGHAATIVSPR